MGQKAHPEVWEGSGGSTGGLGEVGSPPVGLGGVGRTTRRSKRGWEANPEVRKGSKVTPGGPRGVARPTQRYRREGGPSGGPVGVGIPLIGPR